MEERQKYKKTAGQIAWSSLPPFDKNIYLLFSESNCLTQAGIDNPD
jgi:hypothetical protein